MVVVESLSFKVEKALMAVAFTELARKNTLSWKERSVAKRHGWGACNSLSLLFNCSEMIREDGRMKSCCSTAFRLLTECIEKYWLLNEKVTSSAMVAIRALSTSSLTQVAGRSGLIGQACAMCAVRLFEVCATCKLFDVALVGIGNSSGNFLLFSLCRPSLFVGQILVQSWPTKMSYFSVTSCHVPPLWMHPFFSKVRKSPRQ
jgi:hypothetical protein